MATKILVVLTNIGVIPATGKPTGWDLACLALPHSVLQEKVDFTFASPQGGLAPVDPASVERATDHISKSFYSEKKGLWENTTPVARFIGRAGEFDGVLYPGGHGSMFDLASDNSSIQLIEEFWKAEKLVSGIGHGSIAFRLVKKSNGEPLFMGHCVAVFSDEEEKLLNMAEYIPYSLETTVKENGGNVVPAAQAWSSRVISDGKLVTGQNSASGLALGKAIARTLGIDL
ncbi:hypothetical protein NQ176_g905 [Zarea fungicola]|uniref:Uncharacterized protein n=1 Tax=Zarea fungicola TaxID=93591 RepID=A0ACC1NW91_9HYPO|nr:hypothetical protein NQ176_g905 [Lecanicillium fungicola]